MTKKPSTKRTAPEKTKEKIPGDVEAHAHNIIAEIVDELGDEIPGMPFADAIKHLPAVPTVREVRTLLEVAKDDARAYLILRLLYYTGIRVGELAVLRFADVSSDDGTAFVRGGKENKDRYVCVDPKTLGLVRDWQGSKDLSARIVGLQSRQIEKTVHKYGRLAGLVQKYEAMVRSFSPHSLRHAFATHRYDVGMDLYVLMKLLGHRNLETTLIYVETSMRHARKQYRKTDPLRDSKK